MMYAGGWQLHQYINKLHFHMAVRVAGAMAPRKKQEFNSPDGRLWGHSSNWRERLPCKQ